MSCVSWLNRQKFILRCAKHCGEKLKLNSNAHTNTHSNERTPRAAIGNVTTNSLSRIFLVCLSLLLKIDFLCSLTINTARSCAVKNCHDCFVRTYTKYYAVLCSVDECSARARLHDALLLRCYRHIPQLNIITTTITMSRTCAYRQR